MKFNKQELLNLACQSSNRFVKEGTLLVYERQDGIIFKRSESESFNAIYLIDFYLFHLPFSFSMMLQILTHNFFFLVHDLYVN